MNDTVVAIVSVFFIFGILCGIIAVVAMSVLRAERRGYPGDPLDYEPRGRGGRPRTPRWDDDGPDDHPRWPGGGGDFLDR
jgi:hypothetical protein